MAHQWERVQRALDQAGPRGITRVDFLPPVIDGGAPILNFPGRIYDVKKRGYAVVAFGQRDGCDVFLYSKYVRVGAVDPPLSPESRAMVERGLEQARRGEFAEAPPLFDVPASPRSAIWDDDDRRAA
jgi:hypothetical protein